MSAAIPLSLVIDFFFSWQLQMCHVDTTVARLNKKNNPRGKSYSLQSQDCGEWLKVYLSYDYTCLYLWASYLNICIRLCPCGGLSVLYAGREKRGLSLRAVLTSLPTAGRSPEDGWPDSPDSSLFLTLFATAIKSLKLYLESSPSVTLKYTCHQKSPTNAQSTPPTWLELCAWSLDSPYLI